jgi:DNA-binding transcriptional regulator of glucitol operon
MWDKVSRILVAKERTGACELMDLTFFVALVPCITTLLVILECCQLVRNRSIISRYGRASNQLFLRCSILLWPNHLFCIFFVQYFAKYPSKFHLLSLRQK